MTQGTQIKKTEPHQLKFMSVPMSDSLFHYVIFFSCPIPFLLMMSGVIPIPVLMSTHGYYCQKIPHRRAT